ncbi:MAG TPA: thioredoxin domain-containing protein, partial [Thermoleophilaceae bacterium]|nr:thioredoxin domain-containing protein [Thermoleophilaceae bacterium]
ECDADVREVVRRTGLHARASRVARVNRLSYETSPYLLQHADNPVDWYSWGEEALARAREEDKPILLSIGYAACHWCHVMERECFEKPEIAALMNERFVCIKVDREERPDVDAIYMEACQAMTGHGGWPLNVFLTPKQVPFYAGTYFPPEPRHGLPSWRQVLAAIEQAWLERRDEIEDTSAQLVQRLTGGALLQPSENELDPAKLDQAAANLRSVYDPVNGGFGGAPKFPPSSAIEFLLRRGETEITTHTLRAMAAGGMYDQIGGGFARYSVDDRWIVPHFEKMLYDNALLARAYLHGWQVTGEPLFERIARETLDWVLTEMRAPEGGFYSALDADSEGEEGKFYVWTLAEVRELLGNDADVAIEYLGMTEHGNFEGKNIPVRAKDGLPEAIRQRLYQARSRRVWPGLDDKRLTAWNALMISALAEAGATLGEERYLDAARSAAAFVLRSLRDDQGRLLRTYKDGRAKLNAYLEDHAFLLEALLTLYESSFDPRWFAAAREVADSMIDRFADGERGGFFETSSDHEQLVARRKDLEDNPIPAGNSSAAYGLLRLAALSGEHAYEERALGVFRLLQDIVDKHPQAFAHLLQALDFHFAQVKEVALVGEDTAQLEQVVRSKFRPHIVLAGGEPDGVPLMEGRTPVNGEAAAYVCERFACKAPVTEPAELEALL